ncbi:13063_t:CDS:2, partial [Gigaspora rosea]
LLELAESLEANIDKERTKSKYIYWKTQIPLLQCVKIKSCLNYQAIATTKAELIKYQECFLFKPDPDAVQFIEDDEDIMQ